MAQCCVVSPRRFKYCGSNGADGIPETTSPHKRTIDDITDCKLACTKVRKTPQRASWNQETVQCKLGTNTGPVQAASSSNTAAGSWKTYSERSSSGEQDGRCCDLIAGFRANCFRRNNTFSCFTSQTRPDGESEPKRKLHIVIRGKLLMPTDYKYKKDPITPVYGSIEPTAADSGKKPMDLFDSKLYGKKKKKKL
ncbi:unnamed protein product [Cyprideis torosa]|uniref:Uncharacterized protein n=1 Tax=Cyprideis torosa TaxID=163714 RepID=A0A7R8ZP67_9CRUS|nr:unnamed protein product [Cyprideis torosa]CAG0893236.1 unnamed protein product [Cyprideis torosa]